jgi:hypothetical protein
VDRTALTQRLLLVYSGVFTIVLCVVLLTGAEKEKKTSFDEIEVKRINVVEPDGTVRLIISDKSHFPGAIVKGKEYPHDRATAGLLFFNDEATENGGLIFGGKRDKDGKITSWGHLSFDPYEGDQVMMIDAGEEEGQRHSAVEVIDQPDIPINQITDALLLAPAQPQARLEELFSKNKSHKRIDMGRNTDQSAALQLKDVQGRDRIVLKVAADGTPSLQFFDQLGNVTSQLPKETP